MLKLHPLKLFIKKSAKLVKKNPEIENKIKSSLDALQENPTNPVLKTHKVITKNKEKVLSSRVSGDIRIIWNYRQNKAYILDIMDIGGHSGKNKVYN